MNSPTLIQDVEGLQSSRFTGAAATAIYLYNIMITMDLEVEHIWSRFSLNLPTLLYITNRYICLISFLIAMYNLSGFTSGFSDIYCKIPFDAVGFFVAYIGWTGLMAMRVYALWRQNLLVSRCVRGLWICTIIATITTMVFAYEEIRPTMAYNPAMRICTPKILPQVFKATPIAPALFETLLTILTIVKLFDFNVDLSRTTLPMLYRVIARDGVIYFVVSTTLTIINMIAWYILPGARVFLLCDLYWAIVSAFMAKLVLNLRIAHQKSMLEQLSTDGMTESRTSDQTGAYGTRTEWSMAGTMGFRSRYIFEERDIRMVVSAVDGDDVSQKDEED